MVDEETYECVKSFCYLGDTLDEMVDRVLLLQLESEKDGEKSSERFCHF